VVAVGVAAGLASVAGIAAPTVAGVTAAAGTLNMNTSLTLVSKFGPCGSIPVANNCDARTDDGLFPGLESDLLFREDLTPVCSRKLFHEVLGDKPLSKVTPDDLQLFTLLHSDTCTQNWQSWLAFAGASFVLSETKSIYFDSCMMSYEAANAGMGFAVANRAYMASDIRAEKLVAPFAVHHPNTAGWYFVSPHKALAARKVLLFKQWVMAEAALTQSQLDSEIGG